LRDYEHIPLVSRPNLSCVR